MICGCNSIGPSDNDKGQNGTWSPPLTNTYDPEMRETYAAIADSIIRQPGGFWKDTIPYDSLNFYTYPVDLLHFSLTDTTLVDTGVTDNGTRFDFRHDYLYSAKDSTVIDYYFHVVSGHGETIYQCTDTSNMKMFFSETTGYLHGKDVYDLGLGWPVMIDDSTMFVFGEDMDINVEVVRVCR
jgi:hypothetical protein